MDKTDRKILNILQTRFPLVPEPFDAVGAELGISGEEVIERVKRLKEKGIIRRIGAVFESRSLGYTSTLCAARVPEEKIRTFADVVNSYPGVTHNYRRNNEYNVWFTFIAPDRKALEQALDEIQKKTGVKDILSLQAVKTYKINATFEL
ncbi:MAG TPA: AsnC family transcriptional regulator [Syntrophales bacterium]|nr:AsnC family transcriptional regulator [Syntrophales bacterium]